MASIEKILVGGTEYNIVDSQNIAPVEKSSTSANAYAVGDILIFEGQLYDVISAIAVGNTLTVGTNIQASSVGAKLKTIESSSVISATGSSMTAITHDAIKQNGMITLNCSCSGNSLPQNSWVTVGTLVNGWRPTTQTPFTYSDNNSVTSIGRIKTNGLIEMVNPNSNSSGVLASATFNVTFRLAN